MGPFNFPWLTFTPFIVIGLSIAAAVLWALNDIRKSGKGKGERS
ncbi:MAG: hypothetical protein U5O15_06410 [Candidatus Krumholzibacteriota bacterium]|nr:hypothetical protein [Candidatus Krumholzibacteriota bacterium]